MNIEQQSEAYDFFNSTAKAWQQKATSKTYNVIENRHAAVLEIMESFHGEPAILDVGCGTGQLAWQIDLAHGWRRADFWPTSGLLTGCAFGMSPSLVP